MIKNSVSCCNCLTRFSKLQYTIKQSLFIEKFLSIPIGDSNTKLECLDEKKLIETDQTINRLVREDQKKLQYWIAKCDSSPVLMPKIPVVSIMGHIDHGKTTLRKALIDINSNNCRDNCSDSSLAGKSEEYGGITQRSSFYEIKCSAKDFPSNTKQSSKAAANQKVNEFRFSLIDTPGHSVFHDARNVVAHLSDLVLLVVAKNDGLMPQTIECLELLTKHSKPYILCINKSDIPKGNPLDVLYQIENCGFSTSKIKVVNISAKFKQNINKLLLAIHDLSKELEIKLDINKPCEGYIIDSFIIPNIGKTSSVVVTKGSMKSSSLIATNSTIAKIRQIVDHRMQPIHKIIPGKVANISGFDKLAKCGDYFIELSQKHKAKEIIQRIASFKLNYMRHKPNLRNSIAAGQCEKKHSDTSSSSQKIQVKQQNELPRLNMIIKCDIQQNITTITGILSKFVSKKCQISLVSISCGTSLSSKDLQLAQLYSAPIFILNVKEDLEFNDSCSSNDQNYVDLKISTSNTIQDLIAKICSNLESLLPKETEEIVVAQGKIVEIFSYKLSKKMVQVFGCQFDSGSNVHSGKQRLKIVPKNVSDSSLLISHPIKSMKEGKSQVKHSTLHVPVGIILESDSRIGGIEIGCKVLAVNNELGPGKLDWIPDV
ncbi:MAG: Translation initiation factor IF-2, mitochondrial [Marteilia pararefringens]